MVSKSTAERLFIDQLVQINHKKHKTSYYSPVVGGFLSQSAYNAQRVFTPYLLDTDIRQIFQNCKSYGTRGRIVAPVVNEDISRQPHQGIGSYDINSSLS